MHLATTDFAGTRANALDPAEWQRLMADCGEAGLSANNVADARITLTNSHEANDEEPPQKNFSLTHVQSP